LITARLVDATAATPRTRWLRLRLETPFTFTAGQAVVVGLAESGQRAFYSIASAPSLATAGMLELLVAADGALGQTGVDPVNLIGSEVEIEGPFGSFGVPAAAGRAPLLLVAGGTGIAPIRSVILDHLGQPDAAPVSVVYSARSADEFAFSSELEALARDGRIALHCTVTRDEATGWPGRTGRIDHRLLAATMPGAEAWCLVCGPAPFVADVAAALTYLGVEPSRVVIER
jgi:NAD(P)H-flavin reductase